MSAVRPDETFARAVVGHVLGVSVEEYDINGRQAAVDALLHYPDGRPTAALEVSSLGPSDEARIMNVLDKTRYKRVVAGLSSCWVVEVPRDFNPGKFRLLDDALRHCEDRGLTDLGQARGGSEAVDELLGLRVRGVAKDDPGANGPIVWVLNEVIGGFVGDGSLELPDLVNTALREEKMQGKLDKLAASGYEERHLFLYIRPLAFSYAAYDNLSFGGPLPCGLPRLPDGLSQLWIASGLKKGGVVRAIAGREWRREHPFDENAAEDG